MDKHWSDSKVINRGSGNGDRKTQIESEERESEKWVDM